MTISLIQRHYLKSKQNILFIIIGESIINEVLVIFTYSAIQLHRINFLSVNFRLSELHLHDNQISDVSGCLRQLTCLTVVTLHNNQLTKLDKVMKEFDRMNSLSVLSELRICICKKCFFFKYHKKSTARNELLCNKNYVR